MNYSLMPAYLVGYECLPNLKKKQMNTYELADEVMKHYRAELPRGFNVNWMQEAATMLRQQQAEIEALKADKALHDEAYLSQMKEIEALKSVVYWLKENRPEVWDDIQKWRKL